MTRKTSSWRIGITSALAWAVAIIMFFPILWMVLTSFKPELDAASIPPKFVDFRWTLQNYRDVQASSSYMAHAWNSVMVALGSTLLGMLFAIPAAWSMAFSPTRRTRSVLLWMLSTKMLPPVGVLVPIYLIFKQAHMLDTIGALVVVLCLGNLPIMIWMLFNYFKDIPVDILEAARMDGASIGKEILYILAPMSLPGLASSLLLNVILGWNESFWTLNLSSFKAAPLTSLIASYAGMEGLFWAKLSAASTLAIAPILVLGWLCQKQLVRGLTFGAVK